MITLHTLKDHTPLEIFAQAKAHLLTQNKKSMKGNNCVYRSSDALMCAVGCFISDEEYNLEMEDIEVKTYLARINIKLDSKRLKVLKDLQWLHDQRPVELWAKFLDAMEIDLTLGSASCTALVDNDYILGYGQ